MKQDISKKTDHSENHLPFLESLKQENQGFRVPVGYFDSLSPRIVDAIKKQENKSFIRILIPVFRKPVFWAPLAVTSVIAILLFFAIPDEKVSAVQIADEWTELTMVYDASYAEEALLAESHAIDNELEMTNIDFMETASIAGMNEPTDEEITKYLKEQEIDNDILIQN